MSGPQPGGASQALSSSIVVEGWAVLEVPSFTALPRAVALYFSLRCCMPCTSGGVPPWAGSIQHIQRTHTRALLLTHKRIQRP